jgi:hypothetical protein
MSACTAKWGCMCPDCRDRQHPLDRIARITPEELAAINAEAAAVQALAAAQPRHQCASCGKPGRLIGSSSFCEDHAPV